MDNAVIISCFDLFETRIMPIYEELSRRYSVTVLTTDFSHTKKEQIAERRDICEYIHVPKYHRNISVRRVASHLCFGKGVEKHLQSAHPRLIYLCLPPNNLGGICAEYKRRNPETQLIVDVIDMWPESFGMSGSLPSKFTHTWRRWRSEALFEADYVITECDYYQSQLKKELGNGHIETVYLYKDYPDDYFELVLEAIGKRKETSSDGVLRFAYLGNINNIIDIDGICNVLTNAVRQGICPCVHVVGRGDNQDLFLQEMRKAGAEVVFHGPIFDDMEKAAILCQCDYAFNMMKSYVKVGMTIKSMEYFSMGLPIINNIKGDTWTLVEERCIGINILTGDAPIDFRIHYSSDVILDTYAELFSKTGARNIMANIIHSLTSGE